MSMPSPEPVLTELDKFSHSSSSSPSTSVSPTDFSKNKYGCFLPPISAAASASPLDIVHSLELISGADHGNVSADVSYANMSLLDHITTSSACSAPATLGTYTHGQYEYELLELMSNPDELLTDPKSLLATSAQLTPIH